MRAFHRWSTFKAAFISKFDLAVIFSPNLPRTRSRTWRNEGVAAAFGDVNPVLERREW